METMELPVELKVAMEKQINDVKRQQLIENTEEITRRYKNESGHGKRLITSRDEAATYAVVRMPATYGAVYSALDYTLEFCDSDIETLVDVGAGTGAATWAADSLIDLRSIVCLEREKAMRNIGEAIMANGSEAVKAAKWSDFDLIKDNINEKGDLVIASYILNELSDDKRIKAVDKLWEAAGKMLLIIEPGTPVAYSNLKAIREHLIKAGGHIIAPCPHDGTCEIDSWCHFTCRIPRSRLHKQLKKGEVPYEDEKYSYLAVSKEECRRAEGRVLRHPGISKGRVSLEICSKYGISKTEIFKKNGDLYKKARKSDWGDSISIEK